LERGLNGRALLAWRLDVGSGKPSAVRYGFDAYFFDTEIMPEDDAGFSIGDSWWDYWFPLACEMRGARIEALASVFLNRVRSTVATLHSRRAGTHSSGSPIIEYWLNEAQCLLVVMKSETNAAADARQEIIEVYMAWRQGKMAPCLSMPRSSRGSGPLTTRSFLGQLVVNGVLQFIGALVDDSAGAGHRARRHVQHHRGISLRSLQICRVT
jgi:hypothetical protein